MGAGPLQGIRVIDLTIWMSGAIGAMLLGDLGADVIKVEGPTGDPVRRYVPIGATDSAGAPGGVNYAYALCNRNKRQVTLDLRDPADRGRLYELVAGRGRLHHQHARRYPGVARHRRGVDQVGQSGDRLRAGGRPRAYRAAGRRPVPGHARHGVRRPAVHRVAGAGRAVRAAGRDQ